MRAEAGPDARRADPPEILRAQDLTRRVDGRTLVERVTFRVGVGEFLAVFGPSGAGKSSLLRLLCRLDEPTSGTVYLRGRDYRELPPRELRRRVSLVFQRPHLFPGTVAENARFGPVQRGASLPEEEVEALLAQVGLGGYGGRDARALSEGEAQRVSLARALANQPDVLLLDEPTAALDEASRDEVENAVKSVIRARDLSCLLVTHDRSQALRLAERAIVMRNGRVADQGPAEEVLRA